MKRDYSILLESIKIKGKKYGQFLLDFVLRRKKEILVGTAGFVILNIFLIIALFFTLQAGLWGNLPSQTDLKSINHPIATEIYTADSVLMGKYYVQNRMEIKPWEISPTIIDALVATEDVRFYEHNGIDYKSLLRVLVKTIILRDESSGGGSTITQQLAKNLYPRQNYWFGSIVLNKLREMVIAQELEKVYSKKEILMLYLNTVPFGEQTYGIKSAALRYFNKKPYQLKKEEIALLVGMLKGPSYYNPRLNENRSLSRRNVVLNQMRKYGIIEENMQDSLMQIPVKLDYNLITYNRGIAPYYRKQVIDAANELLDKVKKETGEEFNLKTDGLKIYTSIDSKLQEYAETAVKSHLKTIQKKLNNQWKNIDWSKNKTVNHLATINQKQRENEDFFKKQSVKIFEWEGEKDTIMSPYEVLIHDLKLLHAGFVAIDVRTGKVKAWVGGIDHKYFKYDHVLSKRQVGSTFKPFVYLAALEKGYAPCDLFYNDTVSYADYDLWTPKNSDHSYGGAYTLKGALTHSVNTVSANLIMETGISNVTKLAHNAGIQSNLPQVPSLALGTAELSLLEMVQAYQTIANKGIKVPVSFICSIERPDGEIIYQPDCNPEQASFQLASETNIEMIIEMLRNVVNRGTGSSLRYKYNIQSDIAGKTGTTQNHADGWFIGFTPDIVAGAWVGAEYPEIHFKNISDGQGAKTALPVWANFFTEIYNDNEYKKLKYSTFEISDSVKSMINCSDYIEPPLFEQMKGIKIQTVADNSLTSK